MFMYCRKCGNALKDGSRFCGRCGCEVLVIAASGEYNVIGVHNDEASTNVNPFPVNEIDSVEEVESLEVEVDPVEEINNVSKNNMVLGIVFFTFFLAMLLIFILASVNSNVI